MGSFNEQMLSESDRGRPIGVAAIASPGTLIHTATSERLPEGYDKVHIYAVNTDDADHVLYLQCGGVDPSDLIPVKLPPTAGLFLTIPAFLLEGGVQLRAYADEADRINIGGYVIRASALGQPGITTRVLT